MERDVAAAVSEAASAVLAAEGAALEGRLEADPAALADQVGARALSVLPGIREAIQHSVAGQSWVLFPDAFKVIDLPDTPQDFLPIPPCAATLCARLSVLGLHALLQKETIAYRSENGGAIFVNLVPKPGKGRSVEKSTGGMRGHTDAVSFPFPGTTDPDDHRIAASPDFVTLAGLKNPDSIPTHVMPLEAILRQLEPEDIKELQKEQFIIECQDTFRDGTEKILGDRHSLSDASILRAADNSGVWVRFSHSKAVAEPDNATANLARAHFVAACQKARHPVTVKPGSLLLINNRQALHGRLPVGQAHGANTRWLLRAYALDHRAIRAESRYPDRSYQLFP